jgi:small ligand-binding sensory domain FIST
MIKAQLKSSHAELAAQLSAILKNPACPAALYNCIGETIVNMANDVDPDGADYIERALVAHAAREEKRRQKS